MPFTLAHPAIVVPLARVWPRVFSLMALAIGAMSPDFEYFVWLQPRRTISHELIGIPLLCVPSGLVVLVLFDRVVKRPLIDFAPSPLRSRLALCRPFVPLWPLAQTLRVLTSLAVGALSHLIWDSFTHANGYFVARWPALQGSPFSLAGRPMPTHTLLQHGCTLLGLALLAFWSLRWLRQQPSTPDAGAAWFGPVARVLAALSLTVVPLALGLAFSLGVRHGSVETRVADTVIATISSWCCAALVFGVAVNGGACAQSRAPKRPPQKDALRP
jgi:hypothetical protein